jgi:hypothetical protein
MVVYDEMIDMLDMINMINMIDMIVSYNFEILLVNNNIIF